MKRKKVCFLLLVASSIIIIFTIYYKDEAGWIVWKNFHVESVATMLNPKDAALRFAMGNYYFGGLPGQGGAYDTAKAEKYFRDAIALGSTMEGLHYQLARVYFIYGDFYTAEAEINKELELHPDFKRSYYVRGLIYGYSNKLPEAEADFKAFLKWKTESWAGHNDLAWVYFMKGDYKNSAATARDGLVSSPNNVWLLNSLGVALLNEGKLTEAKKALTDAMTFAEAMTPVDWGRSYPGNNPSVYGDGLDAMKASIKRNLDLIAAKK